MLALPTLKDIFSRDAKLGEALLRIQRSINALHNRIGIDPTANIPTPKPVSSLSVVAANGMFTAVITDLSILNQQVFGLSYFLEWSTDPGFSAAKTYGAALGPRRDFSIFLGNQTLYWRAHSQVLNSAPSTPVTFGNPATAVIGGGAAAPTAPPSQGSGNTTLSGGGYGIPDVARVGGRFQQQ